MTNSEFLDYLKNNYPHLYDLELYIKEVQSKTGFGEISVSYIIKRGQVVLSDISRFITFKHNYDLKNLDKTL